MRPIEIWTTVGIGNFKFCLLQQGLNLLTDQKILLAENNSALSRLLYKDSDLKKMGRIDKFIKVNSFDFH